MVDREPLLAMNRVKPWREGYRGKVAECVGKALLLLEDINHWAKRDDKFLLVNMKREAIMVINHPFIFLSLSLFLLYLYT